jgi:hypothetical protein
VKKPSIALLLGTSKGAADEEEEDGEDLAPSDDEYQEELAEALGSDEVTPEQVAAMKRFVMSCMGSKKGMG